MLAASLANPKELGVEDFSTYDLILDTRTGEEFALDHIPNAQNVPPIAGSEYPQLRAVFAGDEGAGAALAKELAERNAEQQLARYAAILTPGARVLVYCASGEGRSATWKRDLEALGAHVDVLPGGYMDYRSWVVSSLQELPALFDFRVISGPSWCGKTDLLRAIAATGAQTIDLAHIAQANCIGTNGEVAPDRFASCLLDRMRKLDPSQPVWIVLSPSKTRNALLPEALREALSVGSHCLVSAPMAERMKRAAADNPFLAERPVLIAEELLPNGLQEDEAAQARRKNALGTWSSSLAAVIAERDRHHEQRLRKFRGDDLTILRLPALDAATLRRVARSLVLQTA